MLRKEASNKFARDQAVEHGRCTVALARCTNDISELYDCIAEAHVMKIREALVLAIESMGVEFAPEPSSRALERVENSSQGVYNRRREYTFRGLQLRNKYFVDIFVDMSRWRVSLLTLRRVLF